MKRLLIIVMVAGACQRSNPEESAVSGPAPPPAAALVPLKGADQLDETLYLLEKELNEALAGDLDGDGVNRLVRAEAISDRLLETRLPFAWLNSQQYAVEPKLRQIQALADRILAQQRTGIRRETIHRDLMDLRRRVVELRVALREGGTHMPPSLDQLLAGYAADSGTISKDPGGE